MNRTGKKLKTAANEAAKYITQLEAQIKFFSCPAWWAEINGEAKPKIIVCQMKKDFHRCPIFNHRLLCWDDYDEQRG